MEAKNDLIIYLSGNGGFSGYYLSLASSKEDGEARVEEIAEALKPFLAEGVVIRTEVVQPSRFSRIN